MSANALRPILSLSQFVRSNDIPETAVRVYRRYLMVSEWDGCQAAGKGGDRKACSSSIARSIHPFQLEPSDAEEYVEYLISVKRFDEAAAKLVEVCRSITFSL